ncbi:unnamed protein product, partial [Rotaria socialis]
QTKEIAERRSECPDKIMGLVVNGGIDTETVLKTVEEYKVPPPSKQ